MIVLPVFLFESLFSGFFLLPPRRYILAQEFLPGTIQENKSAENEAQGLNTMLFIGQLPPKKIESILEKNLEKEFKGDPYEDLNGNGQWDPGEHYTTTSHGTCSCMTTTTASGEEACIPAEDNCDPGAEPICTTTISACSGTNDCSCHKKPIQIDFLKAITDEKVANQLPRLLSQALANAEAGIGWNLNPKFIRTQLENGISKAVNQTLNNLFDSQWICPETVSKDTLQYGYHCTPSTTATKTIWFCPPMTNLKDVNDDCHYATQTPPVAKFLSDISATTWFCSNSVATSDIPSDCSIVSSNWNCSLGASLADKGCSTDVFQGVSWHCPSSFDFSQAPTNCTLAQTQWKCPATASSTMKRLGCETSKSFMPGGCNAFTNDLTQQIKKILGAQLKDLLPAWSLWFTEKLWNVLPTSSQALLSKSLLENMNQGLYDLMQGDMYNLARTGIKALNNQKLYNRLYKPVIKQYSKDEQEELNTIVYYLQGNNFYNWVENQVDALVATTVDQMANWVEEGLKGWLGTSTPWLLLDVLFEDISEGLTSYINEYWVNPLMYNLLYPLWEKLRPAKEYFHYLFTYVLYNNLFDIFTQYHAFCPPGAKTCVASSAKFFNTRVKDFISQTIASTAGTSSAALFNSLVSSSTLDAIDNVLQYLGYGTDTASTILSRNLLDNLKDFASSTPGLEGFAAAVSTTEDILNMKVVDALQSLFGGTIGFDFRGALALKIEDLLPRGIKAMLEKQVYNDLIHGSICYHITRTNSRIKILGNEDNRTVTGTEACDYLDLINNNPRYYFMEGFPKTYASATRPLLNYLAPSTQEALTSTVEKWLVTWNVASSTDDFKKSFLKILNDALLPNARGLSGVLSQKLNTLEAMNLVREIEKWASSTTDIKPVEDLLKLTPWDIVGQTATTVLAKAFEPFLGEASSTQEAENLWAEYNEGGFKSIAEDIFYNLVGSYLDTLPTSTRLSLQGGLGFVKEWLFDHFLLSNERDLLSHISYKITKQLADKKEIRSPIPTAETRDHDLFDETIESVLDAEAPTWTPDWFSKTPLQLLGELSETTTMSNATSIMGIPLVRWLGSIAKGCLGEDGSGESTSTAIAKVFGIDPTDINIEDIAKTPLFYFFPVQCKATFTAPCVTTTDLTHGHDHCPSLTISPRSVVITLMAFINKYTNDKRPWYLNDILLLNKSPLQLLPPPFRHLLTTSIKNLIFNEAIQFKRVTNSVGTKYYLCPNVPRTTLSAEWLISSTSTPTSSATTTQTSTLGQLLTTPFWDMLPQKTRDVLGEQIWELPTSTFPCWFQKPLPMCLDEPYKSLFTTPFNEMINKEISKHFPEESVADIFCTSTMSYNISCSTSSSGFSCFSAGKFTQLSAKGHQLEATTTFGHISAQMSADTCSFSDCSLTTSTLSCNISNASCPNSLTYNLNPTPLKKKATQFCQRFLQKPLEDTFPWLKYSAITFLDDLLNAANKAFLDKDTHIHLEQREVNKDGSTYTESGISLLRLLETEFPIIGVFLDTPLKKYLSPNDRAFLNARFKDFLPFLEIKIADSIPCLLPSKIQQWADLGVNNLISNTTIGWDEHDREEYFASCWATITDAFNKSINSIMDNIGRAIASSTIGQWGNKLFSGLTDYVAQWLGSEAANTTTLERTNAAIDETTKQIQAIITPNFQETIKEGIMKNKLEPLENLIK